MFAGPRRARVELQTAEATGAANVMYAAMSDAGCDHKKVTAAQLHGTSVG